MRYLTLLLLSCSPLLAADRPNVLFIAIDDLVPTIGVYGDTLAQTPEIDTLASQGTTFLNHHVQWSVCGPSRAALTTSLMPEETNVMGFRAIRHPDFLPDVITLPEHFRNNGYETACSGKFHDNRTVGTPGTTLTNDQYADGNSVDDPASWSIPWSKESGVYSPVGKPAVDYANDTDSEFTDAIILANGLSLIDTIAAGDKPFFLAVGFKKPHLAFVAPTKYWDLYDTDEDGNYDDDFPLEDFTTADPINSSAYVGSMLDFDSEILGYEPFDVTGMPTESEARELRHGYYACVSFIDNLVGQLVDKLEATDDPVQVGKKMSETTIIVLWGDHGFYLGQQNRWAKHANLEQASKAPLIIYDPHNLTSGVKTTSPANTVDLYPTLCEMAGLPIPEQPLSNTVTTGRPLRGRSLVPVLEDPEVSVNSAAVNHFNQSGAYGYAYRTERFRLIEWVNSSGTVLDRDLFDYAYGNEIERTNLSNDPDYAGVVYELSMALRADPATQGMARLQSSAPATKPVSPIRVPNLAASSSDGSNLDLSWPVSEGVSYRVVSNTDLGATWTPVSGLTSMTEGSGSVSMDLDKEFFLVEVDDNLPPKFSSDPITKAVAITGVAYSGESIATDASDPDSGDTLTFAKVVGSSWLSIASNGVLSGTPDAGGADEGAHYFIVSATDNHGAMREAKLQISVEAPSTTATIVEHWEFDEAEATQFAGLLNSVGSASFGANKDQVATDGLGNLVFEVGADATDNVFRNATLTTPGQTDGKFEMEWTYDSATLAGGDAGGANVGFGFRDATGTDLFIVRLHRQNSELCLQHRVGSSNTDLVDFNATSLTDLSVRVVGDLDADTFDVHWSLGGAAEQSSTDIPMSAAGLNFDEVRISANTNTADWGTTDIVAIDELKLSELP